MNDRKKRIISDDFLDKFAKSDGIFHKILKSAPKDFLILPRGELVKVYYKGCKVLDIGKRKIRRYKKGYNSFVNIMDKKDILENIDNFFTNTKENIDNRTENKLKEKIKQQEMFLKINEENNDFFVFDMEYQQHKGETDPRSENGANDNPRADLVAVKSDGTLVLVELKVGGTALDDEKTGIAGHLKSAADYFSNFQKNEFEPMIPQVKYLNKWEEKDFKLDWEKTKGYIFALIDCNNKDKEKIKEQLNNQAQEAIKDMENWQVFFTEKEDLSELFTYDEYMKGL